jgi:hypothetical protein
LIHHVVAASSDNFQNPRCKQQQPHPQQPSTPSAAAGGYPDQRLHRSLVVCPPWARIFNSSEGPVNPPETFMELHRPRRVRSYRNQWLVQQQQAVLSAWHASGPRYMAAQRHTTMVCYKSGGPRNRHGPPLASSLHCAAYGQKMPVNSTSSSLFPISNDDALDFHRAEHAFGWIGRGGKCGRNPCLGPQA